MLSNDLKDSYNRSKWGIALRGLFEIAIGILILSRPVASVAVLALIVAIWALVEGIVAIVHAFDLRRLVSHWWVLLLTGTVSALFGVAALYYYPTLSLAFVVAWVGWWLIVTGLLGAYAATKERKIGLSWGWPMAWGVFATLAGVLAFVYPGATLTWVIALLGTFGIVGGIIRLVVAFRMQSLERDVHQAVEPPEPSAAPVGDAPEQRRRAS